MLLSRAFYLATLTPNPCGTTVVPEIAFYPGPRHVNLLLILQKSLVFGFTYSRPLMINDTRLSIVRTAYHP